MIEAKLISQVCLVTGTSEGIVKATIPRGSIASPEETARVALFLTSDDSSHITGATILVDDGYTVE